MFGDAWVTHELQFITLEKKEVPDTDLPRPQDPKLIKWKGTKEKLVYCYFKFRAQSYFSKRALASDFKWSSQNHRRLIVLSNFWEMECKAFES